MLTAFNPDLKPFEELPYRLQPRSSRKMSRSTTATPSGSSSPGYSTRPTRWGSWASPCPRNSAASGQGISTLCTVLDHICRVDSSLGGIIFTNALSQEIMLPAKDEDLLKKVFSNSKSASEFLVAFPSFSNPGQVVILPTAARAGKVYSLSGKLEYLVLGTIASKALIPARISNTDGYYLLPGGPVRQGCEEE